ncbi:arginase [Clostridium massiliamazoniense]|uniref:arginase n=1 Tax=Clostridium massiliamazoniense TaxID=1347366 RepID=UPI0006D78523|nr:arginase [Clostridium massiliamazoniense]
MKMNIVGIPLHYGCDRFGVEKGPNKLRENGLIEIFEKNGNEVYDLGNLIVPERPASEKYEEGTHMKWVTPIVKCNEELAEVVYSSHKAGAFPFSVGGDHAMGLGTVAGSSKAFGEDFGVVWIDAHGDINTEESSPSGNIHGMPLASSMGFGSERLKNIFFEGKKVDPSKVFLICQRDLDPGEVDMIKEYNINYWSSADIRERGMDVIMKEVVARMEKVGVNNFHLSFDIDSMDANLVPGTGTPVYDGINVHDTEYMLQQLFKTGKIKAMDFSEYNPGLEYTVTTDNCIKILNAVSRCLAEIK